MLNSIKFFIRALIKNHFDLLGNKFSDPYSIHSYSQEGEDMILRRIFEGKRRGFYVDVGAHHPRRFSNTYYFYKEGWRGINIEPNPEALKAFNLDRPKDINLQLGVSDVASILEYYYFDEPALNTFDSSVVEERLANTSYKVVKKEGVCVERLDSLLNKYLLDGQAFTFFLLMLKG